ncbi:MAG: hypothetical protein QXO97_09265 [Candidatus Nezhaarchaeales archaeon]
MKVINDRGKSDSRLKGLISVVQATGESVAISSERVEGFLLILPFRIAKVLKNRRVVAKADRFGRSPLAVLLYHFARREHQTLRLY